MRGDFVAAIMERAGGICECGCGLSFDNYWDRASIDHFFGRARVKEAVDNCWALRLGHHAEKTDGKPSAATWLQRFLVHCEKHGYRNSYDRAFKEFCWREAKKKAGAA